MAARATFRSRAGNGSPAGLGEEVQRPDGEVPEDLRGTLDQVNAITEGLQRIILAHQQPAEDPRDAAMSRAARTITSLRHELAAARAENGGLRRDLDAARETHAAALEQLRGQTEAVTAEIDALKSTLAEKNGELEAAAVAAATAEQRVHTAELAKNQERAAKTRLQEQLSAASLRANTAEAKQYELYGRIEEAEQLLAAFRRALPLLNKTLQGVAAQVNEAGAPRPVDDSALRELQGILYLG